MYKNIVSFLVFVSVFFAFSATKVSAKTMVDKQGSVVVGKTEVVNDDLFAAAQTVEMNGTVNGDVFAAGQTVKINGIVNGNLHVAGNMVEVGGVVKGNIYAAGQSVLVESENVGGSLLTAASTVNIDKTSMIGGSVLTAARALTLDAQVKRTVYAGTGNLTIGSDARIGRDVQYAMGQNQQASIGSGAVIAGTVHKTEMHSNQNAASVAAAKKQLPAILAAIQVVSTAIGFLGALVVGFLYLKLFGKHASSVSSLVTKSFWKSLGIGFLVTIAFIPGLIILAITVVGIPLAALSLLMLLLYSYLAKIVVSSAFGSRIGEKLSWKLPTYGIFALGLLAISILKLIPLVGFVTSLAVFWAGLGALTLQVFASKK